jgi:hypothetical protein
MYVSKLPLLPRTALHGDKIREGEMGETCNTHRSDEKCIQKFWLENLKGGDK